MKLLQPFQVCKRETATNRQYVGFRPKTDIKIDDVIITPANERLYVTETQASFFQKQQEEIKAFYMTEVEKSEKKPNSVRVIFIISVQLTVL